MNPPSDLIICATIYTKYFVSIEVKVRRERGSRKTPTSSINRCSYQIPAASNWGLYSASKISWTKVCDGSQFPGSEKVWGNDKEERLTDIFPLSIISLQDRIFGGHILRTVKRS